MITEDMLREAAREVDCTILESLPDDACEHTFSRSFQRKMKMLIHPPIYPAKERFLRWAACFAVVCAVLGGILLNDSAHASISEWECVQVDDRHFNYYYKGDTPPKEIKHYTLSQVPEGYTLDVVDDWDNNKTVCYIDDQGQWLQFSYIYGYRSGLHVIGYLEAVEKKSISVDDKLFEVYISLTGNESNGVVWYSQDESIIFEIFGPEDIDTLIALAKSVITAEK